MLTLNDGRNELWQWDTGRNLTVDADCSQVHFSNKVFGRSIDVDVVDGVADIPDILLQTDRDLIAWAFVGTAENGYTKISKVFKVNRRNKPADYVFTPTEQTTLAELVKRLDEIEENQDPDAIKNAVDEYLKQNPVDFPVDSVNGKFGDVNLSAEDVDALPKDASVVKTVNGTSPDSNGNVEITIPDSGGNVAYDEEQELTEEQKAQARANIGAQPVGEYLTEVPEGYAKNEDIEKVDRKVDTLREVVSKFHSNIVCDASGKTIVMDDASDMELAGLRIFGKTTQDGTPSQEAPVELENVGVGGSVTVRIGISDTDENQQVLSLFTPNGLPGIPVDSGGNYTDETSQQWICDEVDFGRGVYVRRLEKVVFDGSVDEKWEAISTNTSGVYRMQVRSLITTIKPVENSVVGNIICSAFTAVTAGKTWARNTGISVNINKEIQCYSDAYNTSDVSIWRSYLADNPMTVIYELAVPIEAPLAAEELAAYAALHTNYPNTTILNDGGAWMAVKYVADTKQYIDQKFDQLAAALVNN